MTLLLFVLLLQPGTALAATRTWDGGGSTNNWSEDANWSDNTEPTAADTALFDATDATDATVDADILIGGLSVTSGYGGTLNLGSATITGAVGDGAVQFTAADKSWLQIADASQTGLDPGTSDFSVSGWVYFDSLVTYETLITKSDQYYIYTRSTGQITLQFNDGTGVVSGNSGAGAFVAGAWQFVSVNFDRDGNAVLSVNNVAKITLNISSKQGNANNASVFTLGGIAGAEFLNGRLDSFSFSNRLLTTDEITWLYNSGNGRVYSDIGIAGTNGSALKTNLVSWWDLGENAGTRYDSYGTNHLSQSFGNIIAPPVYGSEIMSYTGFETYAGTQDDAATNTFSSWTNNASDSIIDATATVHGGSNAVKITRGTDSAGRIYQSGRTVTGGANYRLSFWTRGDGTVGGRYYVYDVTHSTQISAGILATGVTGTDYSLITYDYPCPAF
ncbi:MAG: LamG domain-containing protein [Candidatus Peribacter sp.]|nr:LamG domain-containing protein [Candidatus Peribacter sp.]